MRLLVFSIFYCFIIASCSKVETVSTKSIQIHTNKTAAVSPTIEKDVVLRPVTLSVKMNSKQKKYLNESLSPNVREILEKAEKIEILAEIREPGEFDGEGRTFEPNRVVKISNENDKREVLEAFYYDASREDPPAICYEPHHAIRADYQGKIVEVEICFSCSKFFVTSPFGEFKGTIVRENRKSENVLNRIIENQGVEIK